MYFDVIVSMDVLMTDFVLYDGHKNNLLVLVLVLGKVAPLLFCLVPGCMYFDVMFSMNVLMTDFVHDRHTDDLLVLHGPMYFNVMFNMDVMSWHM